MHEKWFINKDVRGSKHLLGSIFISKTILGIQWSKYSLCRV